MFCKKCLHILACQAFTKTKCKICNNGITTGHIPGYIICSKCSEEYGLCQQCGKEIFKPCLNHCGNITANDSGICDKCANEFVERQNRFGKDDDVDY